MAWLRLEASFGRHPKTKRLARRLGLDLLQVRGLLVGLWVWALEFAPDGDLRSYDAEAIADGCGWLEVVPDGDPADLVKELEAVGLLDASGGGWVVHDWWDYAGSLKAAHAQRAKRAKKAEQSRDCPGTVPVQTQDSTPGRTRRTDGQDRTDGRDRTDGQAEGQLALTSPPSSPPSPVLVQVPCSGSGRGGVFDVTQEMVDQWSQDFPGVDVLRVVRQAAVWSRENASRKKTAKRMRAWLTGQWLSKAQDSGRAGHQGRPAGSAADDRVNRIQARAEAWAKD